MDVLAAELVDELEDASCNCGLADGGDIGEGAEGVLILQNDAVELRDVELVRGRTGGDIEGEPIAGEDGFGDFED